MNLQWLQQHIEPPKPKRAQKTNRERRYGVTVMLTHNGKTQSLYNWSQEIGKPGSTLWWRYKEGWSVEDILSTDDKTNLTRSNHTWRK